MTTRKTGFRRAATVPVTWPEDHEFHGLEVELKRVTVGHYLDVRHLQRTDIEEMLQEVAGALVSWNYEDADGNPVPVTGMAVDSAGVPVVDADGRQMTEAEVAVRGLDIAMLRAVFRGLVASFSVADPLPQGSPRGGPPSINEASIPMTPL